MHVPDGFVSLPVNLATFVAAGGACAYAVRRARQELGERQVPLLGVTAAFIFAAQMLNFPIAGGTSGHFLGAVLAALLLGPWNACLIMAIVLVIQCLGFADGGLTALGTNVFNMGVIGGVVPYFLLLRGIRDQAVENKKFYLTRVAAASWLSVVLASTACALELAISGTSPLGVVLPVMAGVHMLIGLGEATITVAVVSAVLASRRDLLWQLQEANK